MPTQQKIDLVQDIKDRLERSTIAMTTSFSGISVNEMVELRRSMRGGGVDFTVVKNTLLTLAAEEAQKPQIKDIVEGPTAIAMGYDDPADAAKVLANFIRDKRSALVIMGAVMGDGALMSAEEVTRLASLPPKAQLLAMLLGQLQSPIAGLLTVLNGPVQALDNVLQARVRQMEAEAPAPAAEPEAAAEPEDSPQATTETEETSAGEAPETGPDADEEPAADTEEASGAEGSAPEEAPADEPEGEPEPEAAAADDGEAADDVEAAPE